MNSVTALALIQGPRPSLGEEPQAMTCLGDSSRQKLLGRIQLQATPKTETSCNVAPHCRSGVFEDLVSCHWDPCGYTPSLLPIWEAHALESPL